MDEAVVNRSLDWNERALHYGDGLFETILKLNGNIRLWDRHYQRLARGCERLKIMLPEQSWLSHQIELNTGAEQHSVIKIIVTRGRGGRGLNLPEPAQCSVFVLKYAYTGKTDAEMPLGTKICKKRLAINPDLAGIKHLNRLDYVLAAEELRFVKNCDEGILCDFDGYLVEGIISNLFFVVDSNVYTPCLERCGVDGIMRQEVIRYLAEHKYTVNIARFPPELLYKASECFMTNSVTGIRPIQKIEQKNYSTGELTRLLMQQFNEQVVLS